MSRAKSPSNLELRPFTPADAIALEGGMIDAAYMGNTVTLDGEPIAYGGIYKLRPYPSRPGYDFVFFHISDCAKGKLLRKRAPIFVARIVADGIRALAKDGMSRVHVICDHSYDKAEAFLRMLGFAPIASGSADDTFEMQVIAANLGG